MGGKGRRRREKNFRAAHGGNTRLPPAPKPHQIHALPSKLCRIIDFKNHELNGSLGKSVDAKHREGKREILNDQKVNQNDDHGSVTAKSREKCNDKDVSLVKCIDDSAEIGNTSGYDKKKKKLKRKVVDDLRFQAMDQDLAAAGLKKRDRKKKYLEARKKKHKKAKTDETPGFPGYEKINFGEVVEAPPKLVFPKASKKIQDASHERLRLQAIEAYRYRKGWASRPGSHLTPLDPTLLS